MGMGLDTKRVYLPPGCSEEEQAVDTLGRVGVESLGVLGVARS